MPRCLSQAGRSERCWLGKIQAGQADDPGARRARHHPTKPQQDCGVVFWESWGSPGTANPVMAAKGLAVLPQADDHGGWFITLSSERGEHTGGLFTLVYMAGDG